MTLGADIAAVLAQALAETSAAAHRQERARVPFHIDSHRVGSVAAQHLGLLRQLPDSSGALHMADGRVRLSLPATERDAWFAQANLALRTAGAISAWRNETYRVVTHDTLEPLALIERAASRFWGTLTFGAHANGCVADAAGRISHVWIAQRSPHKPTDPGKLDNLVGGGVPFDQTPQEALVREAWEEAGLLPDVAASAVAAGVLELHRDIPEGLQHERLHVFDLALPAGVVPCNQDGEVARFDCVPVVKLVEQRLWREMTLDAAFVTLHFLHRHWPLG